MDAWEVALQDLRYEFEDKIADLRREVEELRERLDS